MKLNIIAFTLTELLLAGNRFLNQRNSNVVAAKCAVTVYCYNTFAYLLYEETNKFILKFESEVKCRDELQLSLNKSG